MSRVRFLLGVLLIASGTSADVFRNKRENQKPEPKFLPQVPLVQGDEVIDSIFNIPIAAIKQTASVAQSFSPENNRTIGSVFQIPISTLEAVGTLVKTTSQRRQNEELQRLRQDKRDRLLAYKEEQRLKREQLRNQRLQQQQLQQLQRIVRHYHKDPLSVNSLTHLLASHQATLGGQHGISSLIGNQGSHGNQGILGTLLNGHHSYEVHEDVDENTSFSWHGVAAGFSTVFGTRPSGSAVQIENKIAPKDKKPPRNRYQNADAPIQNKIAPKTKSKVRFQNREPPLQNKVAPANGRVSFH